MKICHISLPALCIFIMSCSCSRENNPAGTMNNNAEPKTLSWILSQSPDSGPVNVLIRSGSGDLFAATGGGGVYKSTDSGKSWILFNSGLSDSIVNALAIDSSNHIYAGTESKGIYRSSIFSDNWEQIKSPGDPVFAITVDKTGDLWSGTLNGLYYSSDEGLNWVKIDTTIIGFPVLCLATDSTGNVYAGTSRNGVYKSSDDTNRWISAGLNSATVIKIYVDTVNRIWASVFGVGVFQSTTGGQSWSDITNSEISDFVYDIISNSENRVFIGGIAGIFYSEDNGISWDPLETDLQNTEIYSLVLNQDEQLIAGLKSGQIYYTTHSTISPGVIWIIN